MPAEGHGDSLRRVPVARGQQEVLVIIGRIFNRTGNDVDLRLR
jgi:hypothetical protein